MRDRFVRELRRSQNLDADVQVNCSAFFREMLFLASHVRSNKYEIETNLENAGIELKTVSESGDETAEEWIMQEDTSYQENYNEPSQYVEENEEIDHVYETQSSQTDYIEDESAYQTEEKVVVTVYEQEEDEDVIIQETSSEELDCLVKSEGSSKKRSAVEELDYHHHIKKQPRTDLKSPARTAVVDDVNDKDEDIAFGKTIGCMLKKIPPHLKTSVKLELLSSLAKFEAQHNLT
jgi:hypothetical protein